ncbi:MAG: dockerin type I domain-containing protein [Ruminococcus sp.]|nr:dockerin type I domain-containing protein [Ruminococcus sp.]
MRFLCIKFHFGATNLVGKALFVLYPQHDERGNTACRKCCQRRHNINAIQISDAILLARYVAEDTRVSLTNSGKLNADVSGDGKYTAEDTSLIIRIIAQLG